MVFQFLSPVGHKFFCWHCAGIVHGSRIGCQNGGANSDFLHSSGREELDSLPIVLELENTLWFSNSCLQLGTNSFAGIVLELCMDRELVAKMGEPIPIFYTLVSGPLIDRANFKNLFGMIYFDLRNQEEDVKDSVVSLTFRYELNGANPTGYTLNALVLHEKEIELYTASGKLLIKA